MFLEIFFLSSIKLNDLIKISATTYTEYTFVEISENLKFLRISNFWKFSLRISNFWEFQTLSRPATIGWRCDAMLQELDIDYIYGCVVWRKRTRQEQQSKHLGEESNALSDDRSEVPSCHAFWCYCTYYTCLKQFKQLCIWHYYNNRLTFNFTSNSNL